VLPSNPPYASADTVPPIFLNALYSLCWRSAPSARPSKSLSIPSLFRSRAPPSGIAVSPRSNDS
jgi:hypothetical protein